MRLSVVGRAKGLMTYSKKIVFNEKPPKPEDFESNEEYDEALEKFIENVPRDRPISEEVYVAYTNYFDYGHLKDHFFKICDKEYYAAVHYLPDDLPPDSTNTRIFIVANLANE